MEWMLNLQTTEIVAILGKRSCHLQRTSKSWPKDVYLLLPLHHYRYPHCSCLERAEIRTATVTCTMVDGLSIHAAAVNFHMRSGSPGLLCKHFMPRLLRIATKVERTMTSSIELHQGR
jgi:hypothetical protein